jgi:uncharacterized membrane protein YbhN (UPF0104 family)
LGCLAWVVTGINWRELGQHVTHSDIRWMVVAGLLQITAYLFHAWRWNLLLRPVVPLRFWRTTQALYAGLFANETLPLRPGELVRCYLLAAWNRVALSVVASSIVLERLLDGFSLAVAFVIVTAFLRLPHYLIKGVRVMAGCLLGAALLLLVLPRLSRGASLLRRLPAKLSHTLEGTRQMANARTLAVCMAASLANLGLQALPYWALNESYRLDLSIWAMLAVVVVVMTATIIPSAPGNAGLLQAACVLALSLFGVDKTRATGFAALLFLVLTVPLLLGGAAVVAFTGVKFRDLRRGAAELERGHGGPGAITAGLHEPNTQWH